MGFAHLVGVERKSGEVMTFEMFGAGCFGTVIGFVAWHVFHAGETSSDVKRLGGFIGAPLGAAVLSAFPAGTTLFAAYSSGLALGFFFVPMSRMIVYVFSSINRSLSPTVLSTTSEVPDQLKYIDEHWPEIERVVEYALGQHKGRIREWHLLALPIDEAGRVSVLRRYARTHPERTSFGGGFLAGTLRLVERHTPSG